MDGEVKMVGTVEALNNQIDQEPDDFDARMVLADAIEEEDERLVGVADGYRVMGRLNLRPILVKVRSDDRRGMVVLFRRYIQITPLELRWCWVRGMDSRLVKDPQGQLPVAWMNAVLMLAFPPKDHRMSADRIVHTSRRTLENFVATAWGEMDEETRLRAVREVEESRGR